MRRESKCPAYGTLCDYVYVVETLQAENERLRDHLEDIILLTEAPLVNPLEAGFRHSPLTQREREVRYMEACAIACRSARAALATEADK